jgi:hypothetical protein
MKNRYNLKKHLRAGINPAPTINDKYGDVEITEKETGPTGQPFSTLGTSVGYEKTK